MNWPEGLFDLFSLEAAWERVRSNGGAAGVDTISVDSFGVDALRNLRSLASDLASGHYCPLPYRAVQAPKPDGSRRRLVIAAIRDRVVMTAATEWLGDRIEPLFHPCSFAYRPGIGVHDALAKVAEYRDRGLEFVLRADVEAFFDSVDHEVLLDMLGTAGIDDPLLGLLRTWLECAIEEDGACTPSVLGLPQGLPVAPLLANLYLTPFDRALVERGWKLVRYADDLIVCCSTPEEAQRAQADAEAALVPLKLALKGQKTEVASFAKGFTFLGAGFLGNDILPAVPHPYEEAFSHPPPLPRKAAAPSGLPEIRLRTLYVQQQGVHIGRHGGRFIVSRGNQTLMDLPSHHIDQLFLFGRIHLSAAAMAFCLRQRIPVHLFSGRGDYHGALLSEDGAEFLVERAQYRLLDEPERRLKAAHAIVRSKIRNAATLLKKHVHNHPDTVMDDILGRLEELGNNRALPQDMDTVRGFEGAAAAAYFEGFGRCMRGAIPFRHRNRRPPLDPINSLLSFGYTVLLRHVQSALSARGIDPAVGIFHESGRGHPALASDMLEELRAPVVDSLVLTLINRQQFVPDDFYRGPGDPQPCLMKDPARARYLHALEEKLADSVRHPEAGHEVDWRQIIELQVGRVRRFILGETSEYMPFRWE